jgi:hypothetical protein
VNYNGIEGVVPFFIKYSIEKVYQGWARHNGCLHLCPRGPGFVSASLHNKQRQGCLEIEKYGFWNENYLDFSALGTPSYFVEKNLE